MHWATIICAYHIGDYSQSLNKLLIRVLLVECRTMM